MNGFKLFIDGRTLDGEFLDGRIESVPDVPDVPGELTVTFTLQPTFSTRNAIVALLLCAKPPRLTRERTPVRQLLVWRLGP